MSSWGGQRPGSGRPTMPDEKKRVKVVCYVSPETKDMIEILRVKGVKVGRHMDTMIQKLYKKSVL